MIVLCSKMPNRKTTEQFILDAIQTHGNKYDYSKVDYKTSSAKVIIICKEHGEFLQCPNNHLNGVNCPTCAGGVRLDTSEFIKRAKLVHGDKYDYSKVDYKNAFTKIIIGCSKCGDYEQKPNCHLNGYNCPKCRGFYKTNEQFIKQARQIHGDKYDYSKVEYKNSSTKIIIICETHGEIEQVPSSHLSGQGCYKCANNMLKTREEFITDARKLHGDKYDYSKVEYKGAHTKVILGCAEHGEFEMKPNCHLLRQGCYKCGKKTVSMKLSSNTEEFIQKSRTIHGDKYEYSKVDYKESKKPVIIICKIHGEFLQKPAEHLNHNGCYQCGLILSADKSRKTLEQFIQEAKDVHGDKYDYSKVDYKNTREKIIIICKKHGEFLQSPEDHTRSKSGCPRCVNKTEGKVYENLLPLYPTLITQYKQEWCKKLLCLPFDFCIPEHKIIIEVDGPQHFQQIANWSSPEEQFENDKYKEKCANENGYSVIRLLQEDVFYDTYDWQNELCDSIEEIQNSDEIMNVFLSRQEEYDKF